MTSSITVTEATTRLILKFPVNVTSPTKEQWTNSGTDIDASKVLILASDVNNITSSFTNYIYIDSADSDAAIAYGNGDEPYIDASNFETDGNPNTVVQGNTTGYDIICIYGNSSIYLIGSGDSSFSGYTTDNSQTFTINISENTTTNAANFVVTEKSTVGINMINRSITVASNATMDFSLTNDVLLIDPYRDNDATAETDSGSAGNDLTSSNLAIMSAIGEKEYSEPATFSSNIVIGSLIENRFITVLSTIASDNTSFNSATVYNALTFVYSITILRSVAIAFSLINNLKCLFYIARDGIILNFGSVDMENCYFYNYGIFDNYGSYDNYNIVIGTSHDIRQHVDVDSVSILEKVGSVNSVQNNLQKIYDVLKITNTCGVVTNESENTVYTYTVGISTIGISSEVETNWIGPLCISFTDTSNLSVKNAIILLSTGENGFEFLYVNKTDTKEIISYPYLSVPLNNVAETIVPTGISWFGSYLSFININMSIADEGYVFLPQNFLDSNTETNYSTYIKYNAYRFSLVSNLVVVPTDGADTTGIYTTTYTEKGQRVMTRANNSSMNMGQSNNYSSKQAFKINNKFGSSV